MFSIHGGDKFLKRVADVDEDKTLEEVKELMLSSPKVVNTQSVCGSKLSALHVAVMEGKIANIYENSE